MQTSIVTAACALAMLGAMAAGASAQTPANFPLKDGAITFVTPSKNIGCTYTPAGGTPTYKPFDGGPELSCDRIEPKYVRVVLTARNFRRFDNPGDQGCCDETNVLAYGARWTQGPFICESGQEGLSCKSAGGKGFFIGRREIKAQ